MMEFMRIFLYLIIYSVTGWVYETILCSVLARKFVNRGFLTGPWCPIYGFGALLVIFPLQRLKDDLLPLFLSSMVLTMLLEYLTSYVMEKLFHTRWWDYSDKKFQLNGLHLPGRGHCIFGDVGYCGKMGAPRGWWLRWQN